MLDLSLEENLINTKFLTKIVFVTDRNSNIVCGFKNIKGVIRDIPDFQSLKDL